LQFSHKYDERPKQMEFDADTFMRYYRGKNEYRSYGPPENSNVDSPEYTQHQWKRKTGYVILEAKPWELPDFGYTQKRLAAEEVEAPRD
jgi:hypothetical protein